MGYLRINKVIYSGNKYHFESAEFDKNIVVIEGDNGTGKSTLCNLIYFALGGEVSSFKRDSDTKHIQITSDTDIYVELYTTISDTNYVLRRYIGDNDITIIPYVKLKEGDTEIEETLEESAGKIAKGNLELELLAKKIQVYPLNRSSNNKYVFSDWILEKLGISVVELYHGYSTFKINFTNLMRLMYHDQQPDPENIYKKLDNKSSLVSDSEVMRKAIFELLIGKSYSDYYDAIVEEKKLNKEKALAKSLVDEYTLLADKMRKNEDLKNVSFLQTAIQNKEGQLEKLHTSRTAFKNNRSNRGTIGPEIDDFKNEIITSEEQLSTKKRSLINVLDERYTLTKLRAETGNEIQQIQKVIFSHDQLNLFSTDTCPYCLNKVERVANHCVCGATIEEEQYERFFYTSLEYKEILKSKLKTLKTINIAFEGCDNEVSKVKNNIFELEEFLLVLKEKLKSSLEKIDEPIDVESLNDIDDKILQIREDINNLYQLLEIETKLKKLQDNYDDTRDRAKSAELKRKEYEIKAQQDVNSKVNSFSKIYNKLVVDTLPDCRSARIKLDNYLPSIDGGAYREASSRVSIRLMYYITLMHMALKDKEVTFPRFLLIDTPETAGIELENLINCIGKFEELDSYNENYQVILSTGLNKYPKSLIDNRVLFMPNKEKQHMLLKEV